MRSTDFIIVGAGLMGLTTAYRLVCKGYSVRLFDAGEVAQQASWAGGGILWPLYPWRYPEAVQRMAQRGRALYPQFCADLTEVTGIEPQYRKSGLLLLDNNEATAAKNWCEQQAERFCVVDAHDVHGALSLNHESLLLSDVAQVRNPRLNKALKAALLGKGVSIHEHEAVHTVVTDGGRFVGVHSKKASYSAGAGIIAAGAWSSQLLPQVSLFPVKGQMLLLRGTPGRLQNILLKNGCYAIPRDDGHTLIGSTLEHAGYDTGVDDETESSLRAEFAGVYPALDAMPTVMHWAGLRPATPDGIPYVGGVPGVDRLFVNAGHFRNGVVAAPASAELLVDEIIGQTPTLSSDAYIIER